MSAITAIRPSEWERDGEKVITYWITLDDRQKEVPCYDTAAQDFTVGQPLPEGWEVKTSQKGKEYLAPPRKAGRGPGGAVAWRNTREGAEFEQANRIRWQVYEQERMDRRTALMQAVAASPPGSESITSQAEFFYTWLRETSGAVVRPASDVAPAPSSARSPVPGAGATPPSVEPEPSGQDGGSAAGAPGGENGPEAEGEDARATAASGGTTTTEKCIHEWTEAPRAGFELCRLCRNARKKGEG